MRFLFAAFIMTGLGAALTASPSAETTLQVAATLSTFADLVKTVGGDHVAVTHIAPPTFNPHFIEPKPSDVLAVKRADLFVHAGLDLELWRWPLVDAAGNASVRPGGPGELDLSQGIALLEVPDRVLSRAEGDIHIYGNPHYWLDPQNAKTMAANICAKLTEIDPQHEQDYVRNLAVFSARLDDNIKHWRERLEPFKGIELVGYHKSWPYLMRFADLRMEQCLEPKPGIPPTPRQRRFLEEYTNGRSIGIIVQETYYPTRASKALAKAIGADVVLLCQNVGEVPEVSDYVALLDYNINQLVEALR